MVASTETECTVFGVRRVAGHTIIQDDRALAAFVSRHDGAEEVSLDTEFHSERTYWPRLALLQLEVEGEIVIVDPLACDVTGVAALLCGEATLIMHSAVSDIPIIERAAGITVDRLHDTQVAAALLGRESISLQDLLQVELNVRLNKGSRMTDWLARPLTHDQLAYAASDVAYLNEVARRQRRRLDELGRLSWATEEFTRLPAAARRLRGEPSEAITRVKGARGLSPKSRRVASAVAEWRERRARALDIPVRFVLSDSAVVAVAERCPTNEAELKQVRGLSVRGETANALLVAVQQGLQAEVPWSPTQGRARRKPDADLRGAVALACAWAAEVGRREQIAGAMLATRDELEALVYGEPSGRLESGWRRELLYGPVRAIAEGDAALRVGDGGRLMLSVSDASLET
jgi:ribonuclease D